MRARRQLSSQGAHSKHQQQDSKHISTARQQVVQHDDNNNNKTEQQTTKSAACQMPSKTMRPRPCWAPKWPRENMQIAALTLAGLLVLGPASCTILQVSSSASTSTSTSAPSSSSSITTNSSARQQQANNRHQPHYPPRSSISSSSNSINFRSTNNFLVTDQAQPSQPIAQSLPLARQSQDLDNVIESTTAQVLMLGPKLSAHAGVQTQPAALQSASNACQLPPTWAGKWYQSNKEPIRVTNTEISDKGACRDQKGDKFLFEQYSPSSRQTCLVCLVINERHLNVLQYKESSCQPIPASYFNRSTNNLIIDESDHSLLDSVCSDITGDAQLESLFRLDTPSIECPISGQYSFTYDNCKEVQSSLDSCIDKKQLNFKFSACPDVPGSESKSEVLKCYADWTEGNNYYMIGRLEHASNHLDKGKFRCFVYEKSPDGKIIQMAQSLEESCYGLINANEGPKTLRLAARTPTANKCQFPPYIRSQAENWMSVDKSLIYIFNPNSTTYQVKETKEGSIIEEATCLQQFTYALRPSQHPLHLNYRTSMSQSQVAPSKRYQADQAKATTSDIVYLVQITKNCHTISYCVRFYRRTSGIVQIDYFANSPDSDNQCRNAYVGTPQTQIITSTNLEHQRCPFEGAYTIEAPIETDLTYNPSNIFICPRQSYLTAQCDFPSRIRVHSTCSPTSKFSSKNLHCMGSWTTSGLVRLLLVDDDQQRYSAWYRDHSGLTTIQPVETASLEQSQALAWQSQQAVAPNFGRHAAIGQINGSPSMANSLTPIIDLQIALITPLPVVAKPMQVRLTKRQQCTDLRSYSSGFIGSSMSAISSSPPMQSYASSAIASSSSASATNYISNPLPFFAIHYSLLVSSIVSSLLLLLISRLNGYTNL